ncbi:MYXO-CTERM sorting domain-containing protein [Nocardia sp. NBC_01388]|uniref:MYXO-CTERM sorting domain-containing protein n=1 Tax=Nocardia sp. NBC_01388 TaxID=2903596 RepID=UPI00324E6BDB
MTWAAQEVPGESDRIDFVRDIGQRIGDCVIDALQPITGAATVPVVLLAPLLFLVLAWLVRRARIGAGRGR